MKVLIACECSGRVRDAFIARGHDAISCDLKPTEVPGPHHQGDVLAFLRDHNDFDLMIAHPPCTYLARVSAPVLARDPARLAKLVDAAKFFLKLWGTDIPFICIENPYPLEKANLPRWQQTIQPYYFGEPYLKATCLWLKGLPPLLPTDLDYKAKEISDEPRGMRPMKPGSKGPRIANHPHSWVNQPEVIRPKGFTDLIARARTFSGIANAMADQWGALRRPYGFFSD